MNKDFDKIIANIDAIFENGRTREALPYLVDAMISFRLKHGSANTAYASLLNELGSLSRSLGDYTLSESAYQESAAILKTKLGENHPDYATVLNNLAGLYRLTKGYSKSSHLFKTVLKLYENTVGTEDYLYAGALNNLALLRQDENKPEEAIRLQQQALSILRTIPGCEIEYATGLCNLAGPLRNSGQEAEAEKLLLQALSILKQKTGEKSQLTASALNNLGVHFTETSQYLKAKPLFLTAIEICKANGVTTELQSAQHNLEWMESLQSKEKPN